MVALRYITFALLGLYFFFVTAIVVENLNGRSSGGFWLLPGIIYFFIAFIIILLWNARHSAHPRALTLTAFLLTLLPLVLGLYVLSLLSGRVC